MDHTRVRPDLSSGQSNITWSHGRPTLNTFRQITLVTTLLFLWTSRALRGELVVVNGGGTTLTKVGPEYNVTPSFCTGLSSPRLATIGPDGLIYVANGGADNVLRFNPVTGASLGVFTNFPGAYSGLTFGPDGHLYTTDCASSKIQKFNGKTGDLIGTFANTPEGACGVGIRFGPDGNLYVAEQFANVVERFNGLTGASMGAFASGNGLDSPEGITFFNGHLVIANFGGDNVLEFDSTGAFIHELVTSGHELTSPYDVAFGPENILNVSSFNGNAVHRYSPNGGHFEVFLGPPSPMNPTGLVFTRTVRGDTNNNGVADVLDVFFLINYLFAGGPAPAP